jgi:hypothetical protein
MLNFARLSLTVGKCPPLTQSSFCTTRGARFHPHSTRFALLTQRLLDRNHATVDELRAHEKTLGRS